MSKINSILIPGNKNTMNCHTVKMPVSKRIRIPMAMSAGISSVVIVKTGETVLRGQKIGEAVAPLATPVHSSVSGTVINITDFEMPNKIKTKIVEIETDGLQRNVGFSLPIINSKEKFIDAVRDSGVVGLGGAAFPTSVKLNNSDIKTLVVNVAECEPYITSDYRTVMENLDDALYAIEIIKKFCEIETVIFGVEANKSDAVAEIENKNYCVKILKSRYPQGAEKVLIYETTGKILPEGKRPYQIGVVVLNITTLAKLGHFFRTGEPLMSKRVTVDGNCIEKPQNIEIEIGTPISDILSFCGLKKTVKKVIMGGPMMGISLPDINFPIIKSTNAILAFDEIKAMSPAITPCIRCGRCYRSCPFHLMPAEFERRYYSEDVISLERLHIMSCIECGICAYVCPAKRDLVTTNRLAKNFVKVQQRKKK